MPALSLNDLLAIGLCVLALVALGMNFLVHRKHPYFPGCATPQQCVVLKY